MTAVLPLTGFPIGAAFFLPSQGFEDDLRRMRSLGFNVVRIEWPRNGFWEAVERTEGIYSFEILDEAMAAAERVGMGMMLQLGSMLPPRWMRDRFADQGVINAFGIRPAAPAGLNVMCLDHPEVRSRGELVVAAAASRYRSCPALHSWIVWNEPHLSWTEVTCYCRHTAQRFREWLKARYGTIDDLNAAWDDYDCWESWDQVLPPAAPPRRWGGYPAWLDWTEFTDDNVAAHVKWVADTVKREDSAHPTKTNPIQFVFNNTPAGVDMWKMGRTVDILGCSIFILNNSGDLPALVSQCMDVTRSAAEASGKPFWIDEIQAGPTIWSHTRPVTPPDSFAELWPWQAIAHGARGYSHWLWRPRMKGWEGGEFGLVQKNGSPLPRTLVAAKVPPVLARNAELLLEAAIKADVALLVCKQSEHLAFGEGIDEPEQGPLGGGRCHYTQAVMGAYRLLWEEKIPATFVTPRQIEGGCLSSYRALIMPFPYVVAESTGARIAEFASGGGAVIGEYPNAMKDCAGRVYQVTPGAGLDRVFGCKEVDVGTVREGETMRTTGPTELVPGLTQGRPVNPHVFKCRLEVQPGADVVTRYADGAPGLVAFRYEKGRSMLASTMIFQSYHLTSDPAIRESVVSFLRAAGVEAPVSLHDIAEHQRLLVQVGLLRHRSTSILVIINHCEEPTSFSLDTPAAQRVDHVVDVVSETEVPARWACGRLVVPIAMGPKSVRVLRYSE